jgi:hypothetical protein
MAERIVEVVWLDAVHQFEQMVLSAVKPGIWITTVGYLLKRDKKFVTVAMERIGDEYRNVTTIPAALVKRVRRVED